MRARSSETLQLQLSQHTLPLLVPGWPIIYGAVFVRMPEFTRGGGAAGGGAGACCNIPGLGLSSFLPATPGQQDQCAPLMDDGTHGWAGCASFIPPWGPGGNLERDFREKEGMGEAMEGLSSSRGGS